MRKKNNHQNIYLDLDSKQFVTFSGKKIPKNLMKVKFGKNKNGDPYAKVMLDSKTTVQITQTDAPIPADIRSEEVKDNVNTSTK